MKREFIRRIDELGRLVLPKELRKQYEFKEGDVVYFDCQENGILIHSKDYGCERSEADE